VIDNGIAVKTEENPRSINFDYVAKNLQLKYNTSIRCNIGTKNVFYS